jgi:AbrB family looped-hinge helix DNA binding protein
VIPKALRDRLGLSGGADLDVVERDGHIEIAPAPTPLRLIEAGPGVAAAPGREEEGRTELPPLTDEIVRDTIEQTRR